MRLTEKEKIVIILICQEMPAKQIASDMNISERTVKRYRQNLFRKLNISTSIGIVKYAIINGIYKLD